MPCGRYTMMRSVAGRRKMLVVETPSAEVLQRQDRQGNDVVDRRAPRCRCRF